MGQNMLISLRGHETMLLRAAADTLSAADVCPISLNRFADNVTFIDANPLNRKAVQTVLNEAARLSSGIWSMYFTGLAERIGEYEPPKSGCDPYSPPLNYEPDPSRSFNSISSHHAEAAVVSLKEHSDAWREGMLKRRLWKSSTNHLLDGVYLPRFKLLRTQVDRMTSGAVAVYAEALRDSVDVLAAFGLEDWRGRPRKNFLRLAGFISLIYGVHLFNKSLGRLYKEVFKESAPHAANALMGDDVVDTSLKEWAFDHRRKGFFTTQFHGELSLMMLGSAEETFLRVERAREVDDCMTVLDYLLNEVKFSEMDHIAHYARHTSIVDVAERTAAITKDESIKMALGELRDEALRERGELEDRLSPFSRELRDRRRHAGSKVEQISSAPSWRSAKDHDDDPTSAA